MDKPRSNAALVANPLPWTIKHRPDGSLGIYNSDDSEIQTERTISSIIEFMRIVSPLDKIEGAKLDCPGCGEPLIASDCKWACDLDTILVVREPELEDVKREAIRAYGPKARVHLNNAPNAGPPWFLRVAVGGLSNVPLTVTDNDPISMAYAALLRAPDYEEDE